MRVCYWRKCGKEGTERVATKTTVSYYCKEHAERAKRLLAGAGR